MKLHLPVLLRKALLACFAVCSAYTMGLVASAADLTLGNEDSLTIDYADIASIPDLENGTLQLNGDTLLLLSNCGVGDGQTYTLLTGVSGLLDKDGNALALDSSNNAASLYFDATQPGTGFWADAILQFNADGTLQLVRHNAPVMDAVTITSRRTNGASYRYYKGVSFENITFSSSSYARGGAIYGEYYSTIRLSGNGSVTFSGNTASSYGGAIYGGENSTIRLSSNGSVTFSGNRASYDGGAIYGSTITLADNESVTFSENMASDDGGAIYGRGDSTIELSGNGSVTFSGNWASYDGGAIYGYSNSTITLSGNGRVTFSGNTAPAYGGAILGYGNLNIRNNDSVLFEKNAEIKNGTYRLRSIYAGSSGDTISLSAAADKSIEFRDSVYIVSGSTVKFNADYTDAAGVVHKQTGDIIFTGKYTESHLNELLAADNAGRTATAEEILNSRTTEVNAMTRLYGGRLLVEDGAVFWGKGISVTEESGAAVRVKDATLDHAGYTMMFASGTALELVGNSTIAADSVHMQEGSILLLDTTGAVSPFILDATLRLDGSMQANLSDQWVGENVKLMYVRDGVSGWDATRFSVSGTTEFDASDFTWVGNFLVLNYNAADFSAYAYGKLSFTSRTLTPVNCRFYEELLFSDIATGSSEGGAIYGGRDRTITLSDNGSVTFSGNTASSYGGAIYGGIDSTITLSDNETVTFSGNSADTYGGAIYGYSNSTIRLSGNGSVMFSGNSASSNYDDAYGGAIYGYDDSTIELSGNGSVEFSGNTASYYGGAIDGSTITLSDNGSVTFIGNTASDEGGAIYGGSNSTIALSGNESVTFSGNRASYAGGAIYGYSNSTITLADNESVTFSGNRASYAGGAIRGYGNLNIRNNDSVLFEKNAEERNETYRLRSIYAGGSGDVISLSASAGKSIEFRDSVYIVSGSTVNLNADYTDADGLIHKQTGDIIFSGKYTEQHLNELLAADGLSRTATAEEILNSRTTVVDAMTNLYGGRLRVEDGAVYMGYGITAMEDSSASVLVKDATLNHAGYDLTFNSYTSLELVGDNVISGNVRMLEASTLRFDIGETAGVSMLSGNLTFVEGAHVLVYSDGNRVVENEILLYMKEGTLSGWNTDSLTVPNGVDGNAADIRWINGDLLVLNYNAENFKPYFRGDIAYTTCQTGDVHLKYYNSVSFANLTSSSSGGAIYGGSNSTIELSGNDSVEFSGNTASDAGGAIYGYSNSTITLAENESVTFSGNSAGYRGGAIYGYDGSTIELSGNGSVTFSGNTAYDGGAIYGSGNLSIRNNDSVLFEKNAEKSGSSYCLRSIYAGGSGAVISLSAEAGKSIEFRDSVYIAYDSTVNLNADYTDANGVVHKQTGDIIFTSAYTEQHLNELLAADGVERMATAEEILNSRTTEVYAMTNLYGGRLRVEEGAVYKGYGITAMEDSAATVLVKDATLNHAGYDLIFHVGTMLELTGNNSISGNVMMQENSTLLLNAAETFGVTDIVGNLNIAGGVTLALSDDAAWRCENGVLLYVYGVYSGWEDAALTVTGAGTYGKADVSWVDNLLLLNYNAETFNCYFNGSAKNKQNALDLYHHYREISFENLSSSRGGAIYTVASSPILLFSNDSVTFSGNTASSSSDDAYGGAIYGSTIRLSGNDSVTFIGNTASSSEYSCGGAIYGDTIELSENGSVEFSGNMSRYGGGAIYGDTIELSENGSVEFSGNMSRYGGGAIYGGTIALSENGSVTFSGNSAFGSGGAIYGGTIELSGNGSVTFSGNTRGAIDGSTIELSGNGSVTFSENTGGAIDGSTVELSSNESVEFSGNTGGAIYGGTIELSGNGSVTFSGNTASSGGAIYGGTIELSGNESVTFSENTASNRGGAIYGDSNSTITLSDNDSVAFIGNTASASSSNDDAYAYGGAIYGDSNSTITLSGNGSVTFIGNTASASSSSDDAYAYGGAIYGDDGSTITLSDNDSVEFIGNTASASSSRDNAYAYGGAIYGDSNSTITLSDNDSVAFIGNTASASSSNDDAYAYGGAIYGDSNSTITLSGNGSVTFIGNTASASSSSDDAYAYDAYAYGGAIRGYGNLNIRNNESVLFEKNAEVQNETYRLRGIFAGGSGAVISLSAAAGKSIEFRDSVYIASGSTVNLNADYTDADGLIHKQTGDIIFTGAYTEQHLNELLAADGLSRTASAEEILNSRTTEVDAMTNLYGGRLRVEDGAVYEGYGITAHEGSSATVLVKDATLNHAGYDLVFNAGTTLELAGENTLYGDVSMLEGSHFSVSIEKPNADYIFGRLQLGGDVSLSLSDSLLGENAILLYVSGGIAGWNEDNITLHSNTVGPDDLTWVGNMLVLNHNADTFNRYFNGEYAASERLIGNVGLVCYTGISFENISGGAIYGGSNSTIALSGNGSVTFSGNTASDDGGAIYGDTIELSGNESVAFSGNSASDDGGAIYGDTIELSGNESVEFSGNSASDDGGAIYGDGTIELSGNESVTFIGNTASYGYGGAIYGDYYSTIELSGNGSVTFIGNTASRGGAIYGYDGSTIELSGNGSVIFSENTASSSGGAIYGYDGSTIELSGNGSVIFSENTASSSGGAICWDGTIELSGNGSVTFSGNAASDDGGAIRGYGNLSILNNDSVLFEKNAEISGETYRLRSIYARGSGDVISLSAAAGKSIEFRDSVYIASGSTVNLNADYTDANGVVHKQTGDIIFTGKYTEQHLNELLASDGLSRTATAEEILNSRTTEVCTMTNLYGGRLRVEDGAVYMGYGITVHEGSAATVLVKDATLNHAGYDLAFLSGTTLELVGDNVISGNVRMHAGSTLNFDMTDDPGYTTHSGGLSIDDDTSIRILLKPETWDEERGALKTIILLESDDASLSGVTYANTMATVSGLWGYKNAEWSDGQLKVLYQHGAVNATWTNESGDGRWNHTSKNWVDDGFRFADVDGANIILGAEAAGNILLEEEIAIGNMTVRGNSSYALEYGAGAGLMMSGDLQQETGSSLTIGGGIVAVSVLNDGSLEVAGNLEVQQSVRGAGELRVAGSLSAAGLLLTDEQATHSIGGAVMVGGAVEIAGSLSAGGALSGTVVTVGGALSAASLTADSLSAASLRLTDTGASNAVKEAVSVSDAVEIAGSLSAGGALSGTAVTVGGALSAASLTADNLHAASLWLTDTGASNAVKEAVSVSGAVEIAGSLSAAEVHLTDEQATHSIGGAVTIDGAVEIAGSLCAGGSLSGTAVTVGGALSAASLTADSLSAASLRLTDTGASNAVKEAVSVSGAVEIAGSLSAAEVHLTDEQATHSIGGAVTIDGAVEIAGSLCAGGSLSGTAVTVGGALSAASLTADSLSAASLRLTDSTADNRIGSSVEMSGAANVAGRLSVEGNFTAASLQTAGLVADALTLTDSTADNRIGGSLEMSGAVDVGGSLSAGGSLSGTAVTVGGALSVASLTADSLSAASLELTAAGAANSVSGDLTADAVSLASGASLEVGGTLTAAEVLIHGPAKVLQAGAFGAETMNFVLDRAALESLNLSYEETGTIARANTAMGSGFTATLNGGTMPVQAAAYVYDISVNGGAVQLTADYTHDGLQVWYRSGWVGQSDWTDFYIAGYDAVNGVETVDLGGGTVQGAALVIAYEDDVRSSLVKNGELEFEYVDMGGGQFELGENATMTTDELYGKGETLVMHRDSVLNATELTLGTLALEGGELTVKKATINAMSGTEGTLNIENSGELTVKSDVTLTGLENLGSLDLGKNTLTVNALVDVGGDVTAGEVAVQSRASRMAEFAKLVADKVTVVNNISAGRYTDDLSVGDGSAIGELVAEMLEVREGVVTLGRTDAATEQVLKALDLQEDAALVLNQQTSLSVTDELSATEGAELRLKQQASVSYGDMNISNRGAATQMVVNAYELANDSIQELSHAHVAVSGSGETSIDYKLTNSSVENTGSGKLVMTHAENTLSGVFAAGGDITVMNQALALNLDELVVGEGVSFSAYRGETELPEQEAVVSVSQSVSFGAGAHINADLKLQSGVRVEMNGPVSMGSDLYLFSGMTLGGAMLENIQRAEQGQTVVLFSGIDTLYLSGEEQTDAITLSHGISASEYFVNLISSQERSYYLIYDNEMPGEGVLSIAVSGLAVPEPTTSTLSLLALAALAARRRRK